MRAPESGLTMNRCAAAGLCSAAALGMRWAALEILASAEASASGRPLISAPARSAEYSRVRLIAIWTIMAASGATSAAMSTPTKPSGLLRLPPKPPKNRPKLASMETAPASVAVIVMVSVSRLLHMAEFMGHDAGDLVAGEHLQQAGGGADGGMLGVAAGGEGIGLRVVGDIDARHGQVGARGKVADEAVEFRRARSSTSRARFIDSTSLSAFQ